MRLIIAASFCEIRDRHSIQLYVYDGWLFRDLFHFGLVYYEQRNEGRMEII